MRLVDVMPLVRQAHRHTHLCMYVCVWVNCVPGFTAVQGHNLQPHHRSAGDSSIPDQQKVRHSQEPPRRELRGEISPPFSLNNSSHFYSVVPSVCTTQFLCSSKA